MRIKKKFTVKEWKKCYKIQEVLCQKFAVILTDHKTKKEKLVFVLEKINLKNIHKGIDSFNKIIQEFDGSMNQLTTELNKSSQNNIEIWSDLGEKKPKSQESKDQINLEKIWGDKFEM